jgi:hypothetical protein
LRLVNRDLLQYLMKFFNPLIFKAGVGLRIFCAIKQQPNGLKAKRG